MFSEIKRRQKGKGFKLSFNKLEFIGWFIQKDGHVMYSEWVKSAQTNTLKPSVDRINPLKGYEFNNMQLVTWGYNFQKGRKDAHLTRSNSQHRCFTVKDTNKKFGSKRKKVCKLNDSGVIIKRYESISDASRDVGVAPPCITKACKYGTISAGHYWNYIN